MFALALVAGCATPPPADDKEAMVEWEQVNDPLEPMNRTVFAFNQAVDKALLKPLAQAYREAVPPYGRDRVRDFLNNLRSPIILANDILQGAPDRAVQTLMRFAFNTGFGIGGLFDLAGASGIPYHDEDFGQTFAVWGIGEGPYLVLPIIGPSNPRDGVGLVAEWLGDPVNLYIDRVGEDWAMWTRSGLAGIDKRESLLDTLDEVERTSLDYYSAIRALYRQRRDAEIKNSLGEKPTPGMNVSSAGGLSNESH
ncbi:VacJ family lipoprotein [Magnetospirillum sp. UT-4]|uniref:MlaA family lipoprotein n=1 Tax=Magnetospirillum sp. UT-4 TaxID=2681467 RepID=UPI0020C22E40|nr:VacJ family lipoprotein [Magnetospirillum sp. UT-4]